MLYSFDIHMYKFCYIYLILNLNFELYMIPKYFSGLLIMFPSVVEWFLGLVCLRGFHLVGVQLFAHHQVGFGV
ncbi:hypothetical protein DsansV1_C04g0038611 [Dioscorea sansibarensis]